jgi:hypothetical protein
MYTISTLLYRVSQKNPKNHWNNVLLKFECPTTKVMAKGDGREVGDRERTGSSWVFISCSWWTRMVRGTRGNNSLSENLCNFQTFESLLTLILTTEYLYKDHVWFLCMIHYDNQCFNRKRYVPWGIESEISYFLYLIVWFSYVLHAQVFNKCLVFKYSWEFLWKT